MFNCLPITMIEKIQDKKGWEKLPSKEMESVSRIGILFTFNFVPIDLVKA